MRTLIISPLSVIIFGLFVRSFVDLKLTLLFATGLQNPDFPVAPTKNHCGFPPAKKSPPYLCLVTETTSCDTVEATKATFQTLRYAVRSNDVDLISIRVTPLSDVAEYLEQEQNVAKLAQDLVSLSASTTHDEESSNRSFAVMVSSDWRHLAQSSGADGVHFKGKHFRHIPLLREEIPHATVGMSVHTYQSAIAAFREFNPDYFFAGTCFLTASHPEKAYQDLEGPAFPGDITRRLEKEFGESVPIVIAIGGIDETNCQVPIQYGAGGVAAIRAISQSSDPENIVRIMKDKMKRAMFF